MKDASFVFIALIIIISGMYYCLSAKKKIIIIRKLLLFANKHIYMNVSLENISV